MDSAALLHSKLFPCQHLGNSAPRANDDAPGARGAWQGARPPVVVPRWRLEAESQHWPLTK